MFQNRCIRSPRQNPNDITEYVNPHHKQHPWERLKTAAVSSLFCRWPSRNPSLFADRSHRGETTLFREFNPGRRIFHASRRHSGRHDRCRSCTVPSAASINDEGM